MAENNSEQSLRKLLDEWATAELQGDTAFLERTLTDDYIGIGPRGFMLTKEDWLQRYNSGDLRNEAFNFDEVKIRFYGDSAIVTGRQIQKTKYQGNDVPGGDFRSTLVWVQQQDSWHLVGLQLSPILGRP